MNTDTKPHRAQQAPTTPEHGRGVRHADKRWGRLLVTPTIVLLVIAGIVPLVYSIWASFVTHNLRADGNAFVGFDNYAAVLSDPVFRSNLRFTFLMAAVVTVIEVGLALTLALILSKRSKAWRRIMIPLIVAPMFISGVVVGQIWRLFTARTFGPLNYYLGLVSGTNVTVDWLATTPWNMITIAVADVWQWTALAFLIIFAGLTGMDQQVLEAAEVDGASKWQKLRFITLPLIAPALATATFFRFADALRIYDKIVALTGGGPGRATSTISFYLVEKGFSGSFNLALSAAASWIFLILISAMFYRVIQRRVLS
ncbi:MAG: ABC transporter permease subunit [Proteobacteria bacterium]|nr:sugar ABC transporter permease [Actinomycetes bacterium]NHZ70508.1 ABC transporter permease subunit [Pseudomonadota bacterium]